MTVWRLFTMVQLFFPIKTYITILVQQLSGKKQNFICKLPDCGKIFRYKSEILRHISTHSDFRPHPCPYDGCKKSFKRADALENHVRTHTKETPFICTVAECSLKFTTKASLRYHILKHKDQKIYKCNFPGKVTLIFAILNILGCSKAFITIFQLKQHEKSACIHKKIKVREGQETPYTNSSITHNNPMTVDKDTMLQLARPTKIVDWDFKPHVPIQKYEETQGDFDHKVRNILTENEILKKRLEFSQKIITLLQKNDSLPYMDQTSENLAENAPFFYRASLFQGSMYE